MKAFGVCVLAIVFAASPAIAQAPADNDKVLQAIQALSDKIDRLQGQVDALEAAGPASAKSLAAPEATLSAPQSSSADTADVPPKALPGWMVDVMPYVEHQSDSSVRLFRFNAASAATSFSAHKAVRPITQNVWHRGHAKLNVYAAGQYGFSIEFDNSGGVTTNHCLADISIDQQGVLDRRDFGFRKNEKVEFNGAIDLASGSYDITYEIGCGWADGMDRFQGTKYSILILGPDDNAPRYFRPNELFTLRAP